MSFLYIYLLNCSCLCSSLPVHIMIVGSCSMQAMCGGHHEIFSYASTAGTLQEGSLVGQDGFMSISLQEGYSVSLRYRFGYRFVTGEPLEKKDQFFLQWDKVLTSKAYVSGRSAPRFFAQLQIAAELVRETY